MAHLFSTRNQEPLLYILARHYRTQHVDVTQSNQFSFLLKWEIGQARKNKKREKNNMKRKSTYTGKQIGYGHLSPIGIQTVHEPVQIMHSTSQVYCLQFFRSNYWVQKLLQFCRSNYWVQKLPSFTYIYLATSSAFLWWRTQCIFKKGRQMSFKGRPDKELPIVS